MHIFKQISLMVKCRVHCFGLHVKKKKKISMVHVYGAENLYANKFGLSPV